MIPMSDLEVEVMLLHFQIFFIVKTRRYAIKYENEHKELKFLDVTKKNNLNQPYDFAVFFFLLIHCKFMCCSQHFTTYLLSLQNILFFDWRRASYIILLICMLACNSIVFSSPPNDISMLPVLKTERLPRMHIPIDFINENTIFLRIHVIVILYLGFIFLQIVSSRRVYNFLHSRLIPPVADITRVVKLPCSAWRMSSLYVFFFSFSLIS